MSAFDTLEEARRLKRRCLKISERIDELEGKTIGSPVLTGMPKASSGNNIALEARIDLLDELRTQLQIEEARRITVVQDARQIIDGMPTRLYEFALYYYICGLDKDEVKHLIDREDRQVWRYIADVKAFCNNGSKMADK